MSAELLRAKHQASDYERRMRDFEASLALEKRDTQVGSFFLCGWMGDKDQCATFKGVRLGEAHA